MTSNLGRSLGLVDMKTRMFMNPRRIATIIFVCVAALPAFAVGGQDLQPIPDRSRRVEIPGVSVLPPQGKDWFLSPYLRRRAFQGMR
jgi:hypothetical protein